MKERVIALGFFDGVHLGHGALLRRAAEEAALRGCTPAVFTFDRPPKEVVTGVPCPLINSPEDRRDLVRRLYRIQDVLMVPFDREMMTTPWDDFIVRILVGRYHAVHLVAGHDHHFGHRNQGTPELLAQKCAQLGLGCDIIPKVEVAGITVSSTYIRRLVELGQISRANRFLGHPHTLTGTVRHGRGIGSSQLFPTANLVIPPHVLVPSHGVYATRATLEDGSCYAAVTNVGTRPTVQNGSDITVEACLLDFQGDLYGKQLRLEFYEHLRQEVRFDSLDALRAQIQSDADATRTYFADGVPTFPAPERLFGIARHLHLVRHDIVADGIHRKGFIRFEIIPPDPAEPPMVSAGIVSRHPAGLLHQLPGGDALAGRIVPHDEDRLLKKTLVRGIHHHDPSGNAFHHPLYASCLSQNLDGSILSQRGKIYTASHTFFTPLSRLRYST